MNYDYIFTFDLFGELKKRNMYLINGGTTNDVRGCTNSRLRLAIINLIAKEWQFPIMIGDYNELISEISKTIVHETCHIEIDFQWSPYKGEERMCQLLAGQRELRHVPTKKRKLYI